MPVRRSIHPSSTPKRAAIAAFRTTVAGRLTPTEATAAVTAGRADVADDLRGSTVTATPYTLPKVQSRLQSTAGRTRQPGGLLADAAAHDDLLGCGADG
jgi:hypothetical protein